MGETAARERLDDREARAPVGSRPGDHRPAARAGLLEVDPVVRMRGSHLAAEGQRGADRGGRARGRQGQDRAYPLADRPAAPTVGDDIPPPVGADDTVGADERVGPRRARPGAAHAAELAPTGQPVPKGDPGPGASAGHHAGDRDRGARDRWIPGRMDRYPRRSRTRR